MHKNTTTIMLLLPCQKFGSESTQNISRLSNVSSHKEKLCECFVSFFLKIYKGIFSAFVDVPFLYRQLLGLHIPS